MAVTAKQIAEELGLSQTAVSMALHNKPGVSTETRRVVLEAAERMGYDLKKLQQDTKKAGRVCILTGPFYYVAKSSNYIFSEIIDGAHQHFQNNHYRCESFNLTNEQLKPSALNEMIMDFRQNKYDGLLLVGADLPREAIIQLLALSVPMVIVDAFYGDIPCSGITISNRLGGAIAAEYLSSKYNNNLGYLRSRYRVSNFDERINGFMEKIRDIGFSRHKVDVQSLSAGVEGATSDMNKLLDEGLKPTRAYFAETDELAAGAMISLRQHGYKIPDDVAIMGFDNLTMSRFLEPTLTTIEYPKSYMGRTAAKKLLEDIECPCIHTTNTELTTTLVVRHSA